LELKEITMINEWFAHWEPTWLFIILFVETLVGLYTAIVVTAEYKYDERKDLQKKLKRTKTTKKTTDGQKVTEETTETEEPLPGDHNVNS